MAKLNFFDIYTQKNMEFVKQSTSWEIWKDHRYYYKFLQEQNYSALNGKVVSNLEFMMDTKNQIEGLNPVSDIYYIDDIMFAYRTPIVIGKDLREFISIWNYNLDHWKPFLIHLISFLLKATPKGYIFPDLFTPGNILYQDEQQKITLIDNDGIQVEYRWTGNFDCYGYQICYLMDQPIRHKYFDSNFDCYTENYNFYAFYSWFLFEFLNINLASFLNKKAFDQSKELSQILKEKGIPTHMDLFSHIMDLINPNVSNQISIEDFCLLCEKYTLKRDGSSRKLVPK